jgi:chromosomal replication initiator protein
MFSQQRIDRDSNMQGIWEQVLNNLQNQMPPHAFKMWVEPMSLSEELRNGKHEILCQNSFSADYVNRSYRSIFESAFKDELGENVNIDFVVNKNIKEEQKTSLPKPISSPIKKSEPKKILCNYEDTKLSDRYTFQTFTIGKCNKFAYAASLQAASGFKSLYNPLFIYGGPGVGKTHLLNAIGNKVHQAFPEKSIRYIRADNFMSSFVKNILDGKKNDFTDQFLSYDMLLIDDIHLLSGKTKTQVELLQIFNDLYDANKQIILVADCPPLSLKFDDTKLLTRFAQGLVTNVTQPDAGTRFTILKEKAKLEKFDLPDNIAMFIAESIKSVRLLEGAFVNLLMQISMSKEKISLELAQETLRNLYMPTEDRTISLEEIINTVCVRFETNPEALFSNKRAKAYSYPRQIAMYLSKELTRESYKSIGKAFGGRTHATVLYSVKQVEKMLKNDITLEKDVGFLSKMIKAPSINSFA